VTTLITGGTGSFGQAYVASHADQSVYVFSRDEEKQRAMALRYPKPCYFIGDIRDRDALRRVFSIGRIDRVFHAAALKQVPQCEMNPGETYRTNIVGTENVCIVAREFGAKVVTLSTDKAVEPAGVMGASKLMAERITTSAGFSAVRYGNVLGSRGSIVPVFRQWVREGRPIDITDPEMTRFVITLPEAIGLVDVAMDGGGGLVYVRKSPAATVAQMARCIAPGHATRVVGTRPGEKQHEHLIAEHESFSEQEVHFEVVPGYKPNGRAYGSLDAPTLTDEELTALIVQVPE
jgi:FlaA1/EpsC-like NDP-sugar epimerase